MPPEATTAAAPAAPTAPAGGEPTIESLAALLPDPVSAAPENTADAVDAAKLSNEPVEGLAEGEAPAAEAAPAEEPAPELNEDAEALARAEAAAKRAREGSRRFREMREAQEKSRMAEQRAAREAAQARKEAEEGRALRESLTKDPYKALKGLGMTDEDLAERALREGTPEALLHEMREQVAAERAARLALEERLQNERAALARQTTEQNFLRVADNEARYPQLSNLSPRAQLSAAREAIAQIVENGYDVAGLTDAQVALAAERYLAPKRALKADPPPAPRAAPPPAAKAAPPQAPAPKTLTNAVTQERAVAARPWHELSEDEQIAQIAASLPDAV
ncbi:hypothetical protein AKJ09_00042 [Labilithrix luteola]|uniref:Uncharacterized protein n=1 Tax=Labilithrix luteola TaxID=1391654 RepID=A0A0K1PIK3_9BACT|nr:hypothetical protein [Labilithrix luteola]AKU93378.1 hypothetical protein AKJ09_00042 [Labilithrix luteola]